MPLLQQYVTSLSAKNEDTHKPKPALYYFPRYKSNPQHHQYDDFCRVKLMLAHPHRDPNELRKIDGVEYDSYASAAEFCYGNHRHPDDYYGTPNAEERRPDPDEFEEEFHEPDLLETGLSLPASFPTAHQAKR
ncbi:hypothetical protein B0J15DRAFT_551159 [Fusarium solani]|uniref:Uncharacterized protein n=1 Tax=Fusarium solani TaxID=169388 RepID=A0A9P9K500_FUSSL|nr:uncharacterized protein B0J15DRAFT_551159 [Fusarium solani]KAH7248218.1 hypothetical protein B0J15DRAFT_551159 [Fusarium solani]